MKVRLSVQFETVEEREVEISTEEFELWRMENPYPLATEEEGLAEFIGGDPYWRYRFHEGILLEQYVFPAEISEASRI